MTTELAIRILTGDVLGTNEQTHDAVKMAVEALLRPPAQPEIIRCRNCKHHDGIRCFRWNSTIITGFDDFCSNAERWEDEQTD